MTTTVARVEVLTAEVRILDVGGARLTPGMLDQLDAAGWDEITPLGRIRPPGTDAAFTETVGSSARGWDRGALVRSVLPVPELAASLADGGPPPGPDAAVWRDYLLGLDTDGRDAVIAACRDWAARPLILIDTPGGPT
jgi:hypothetical protein